MALLIATAVVPNVGSPFRVGIREGKAAGAGVRLDSGVGCGIINIASDTGSDISSGNNSGVAIWVGADGKPFAFGVGVDSGGAEGVGVKVGLYFGVLNKPERLAGTKVGGAAANVGVRARSAGMGTGVGSSVVAGTGVLRLSNFSAGMAVGLRLGISVGTALCGFVGEPCAGTILVGSMVPVNSLPSGTGGVSEQAKRVRTTKRTVVTMNWETGKSPRFDATIPLRMQMDMGISHSRSADRR